MDGDHAVHAPMPLEVVVGGLRGNGRPELPPAGPSGPPKDAAAHAAAHTHSKGEANGANGHTEDEEEDEEGHGGKRRDFTPSKGLTTAGEDSGTRSSSLWGADSPFLCRISPEGRSHRGKPCPTCLFA